MKKPKETVLFTLTSQGDQVEGPADLAFYDVVKTDNYFDVRYYGGCKVASFKSLEDAKEYILSRSEYVLDKRDIRSKREIYKLAVALKRL